ncbi:MAG: hypothetical protein HY096_15930 [Nitrospinae bacterium]|nr:hypothetical protein [Nitrospinota bacterium]
MKESFKGFETWLTNTKMRIKMYLRILKYVAIAHMFFLLILSYFFFTKFTNENDLMVMNTYIQSAITASVFPNKQMSFVVREKKHTGTAEEFRDFFFPYAKAYFQKVAALLLISLSIYLLYPLFIIMFNKRAKRQSEDKYIRGQQVDRC